LSEKIVKPYRSNMLPIVFGAAKYSKILPPHSYIDALDFQTPKHLAQYLEYLDENEDRYLEYFWWRDFYE
jgi:alpha-1,3-fucosyltransferase